MENLDTFLAAHPPFDAIELGELGRLASGADVRTYEKGAEVLVEDGPPATGLWVIVTGSMELVHEGEVIQVLEPGECFGHPSLLTGMAPAFTVRAREPSSCALLGAEAARRVLGTEAGTAYVASTMRKRMVRTGQVAHGLLDVGTTPVSAIMRPPVFCDPDEPIRSAVARLDEERVSELLVRLDDERLGIVTDVEVRARVGRGEISLDAPVREIARSPVTSVPVSQLAIEAVVDMLASGTEHLVILDGQRICGTLSGADLIGLRAHSPIALRHTIQNAHDEAALIRAVSELPRVFGLLVRAGVPSRDLGQVLSLQHDAIVARLVDFSILEHGPAPVTWAWLDLGSAARREFTLASDQDNALAYATPAPGEEADVDAYFGRMGTDVNDGLVRCGIGEDNNGVLAGRRLWRMSKPDWLSTFDQVLEQPDESHLIRASVAFDFRPTAGSLALTAELTERIRAARRHPAFMRLMAKSAVGYPVALGFRHHLSTGRDGNPKGTLNIKRGAIIPLVNLVRFHALANGVTISPTLDRIEAVASLGSLDAETAQGLSQAFGVICAVRFEHHASLIAAGARPDNLIAPDELAPITRSDLREALVLVRRAQRRLSSWAPAGV